MYQTILDGYCHILLGNEGLVVFFLMAGLLSKEDIRSMDSELFMVAAENSCELLIIELLRDAAHTDSLSHTNQVPEWIRISGGYPIHKAARAGLPKVTRFLLETLVASEINNIDDDGKTPMELAMGSGHQGVIEVLVEFGAEINRHNTSREPHLLYLVKMGDSESCIIIRYLLTLDKLHANACDQSGRTPLCWAVVNGNWEAMKLLLDSGRADIDIPDDQGRTPLSCAAGTRFKNTPPGSDYLTAITELLATSQVDVNSFDNSGRTPLSWAATGGWSMKPRRYNGPAADEAPKAVRLLLERGPSPKFTDCQDRTVHDWCNLLLENGDFTSKSTRNDFGEVLNILSIESPST